MSKKRMKWRLEVWWLLGALLLSGCGGPVSNGLGNGGYMFSLEDELFVAIADLHKTSRTKGNETETTFELVGPVAVVKIEDLDSDWEQAFRKRVMGGEWTTKQGKVLLPGNIYYVDSDGGIALLCPFDRFQHTVTLTGDWSTLAGSSLFFGEMFHFGWSGDEELIRSLKEAEALEPL